MSVESVENNERITKAAVKDIAESIRELVDVLDAVHEMKALAKPELQLFIALRNALVTYDGAQAAHEQP